MKTLRKLFFCKNKNNQSNPTNQNNIPDPDQQFVDLPDAIKTMTNVTMFVDNKSTVVTDDDVQIMVDACNLLMPEVASAWSVSCPIVKFGPHSGAETDWLFHIIDEDPNEPGALAYHTVENKLVDGYILAKTILNNNGVALNSNGTGSTVAGALFHELVEALGNPETNAWWKNTKGKILDELGNVLKDENGRQISKALYCASELCDPVQDNIVAVTVKRDEKEIRVELSDFILPAWSDPNNKTGPYNYLKTLKAPFTVAKGGYVIYKSRKNGNENQVFDDKMPDWLINTKKNHGRIKKIKK